MDRDEAAREQAEQFASIPWSSLAPAKDAGRNRAILLALTVVLGVVIGVVGGNLLRGGGGTATVITLAPVAVPAIDAPQAIGIPEPAPEAMPIPTIRQPDEADRAVPAPPRLYSEADLMAVLPEEEVRVAVMRAEWFVTDFFTVDGSNAGHTDVVAALGGSLDAPIPHAGQGQGISYVEWARSYLVEPIGPARYRVSVAFRTLAGPDPADLERTGVRAVAIEVHVGENGASVVADLPSPLGRPATLVANPGQLVEAEPPENVVGAALETAAQFGSDPAPVSTGTDVAGWRIVVMVGDGSGLRWPVTVRP